jgi:4-oxalomesaconate tautomerase
MAGGAARQRTRNAHGSFHDLHFTSHAAASTLSVVACAKKKEVAMPQTAIPCVLMRGGTSKGPYFLADDLPADPGARDKVLLALMGSPDARQIDGLGGADSLTSKVAIVSRSGRAGVDVDYLFAQVKIDRAAVDTSPNCGNMLAGVGPFAIEKGLVAAEDGETTVRVFNVNTGSIIHASVPTPGRKVQYEGDVAIDGVPGTAAPISLNFLDAVGSKTGKLLPTGRVTDMIDGITVSCVDLAMPMVIARAMDFGKAGNESRNELNADRDLLARIEQVRRAAALAMGMGDVAGQVVPKFCLISPPRHGGTITSRYFVPDSCHSAHAVTGTLCLAAACVLPGSIAEGIAQLPPGPRRMIVIEHPSGSIAADFELEGPPEAPIIRRAALVRTARKLMAGDVFVPHSVWAGQTLATTSKAA